MSVNVTNGVVNFLRRIKTGDYEHKEASATLTFNVDDAAGAGALEGEIERIGQMALARVHTMLGLAKPALATVENAVATEVAKVEAVVEATVAEAKRGRGRPPGSGKKPEAPASADPAALEEPSAPEPESMDDALGLEPEMVPVTDADLVQAVTRKNGEVKNPQAIKVVIAKFAGAAPKTLRDIPQDKRADFLDELDGVKPFAA